jgi:acetyl-CoA synthetase
MWYRRVIGGDRCPIVDTWWQTETGSIMISPLPGVTHGKPGSAMIPIPGVAADVVTEEGESVPNGSGGYLVLTQPWPSMLRTIWGDDDRFVDTYWSKYKKEGFYFAGDGAKKDDDGDLWVLGRVDDVMNVSGHRLSTIELESALVAHEAVAEAAAAAAPDDLTGQAPLCFVILKTGYEPSTELAAELREFVGEQIGKIARPKAVIFGADLPKTRSGKIMRRLLKDVAENREVGDVTTLADSSVMDMISKGLSSGKSDDA